MSQPRSSHYASTRGRLKAVSFPRVQPNAGLLVELLMSSLEEIEKKISELVAERDLIKRQLQKAREQNVPLRDVTRRNSIPRIMTENKVLRALEAAGRPLSTQRLISEVLETYSTTKEVTIRSQLTRMKSKGLIRSAGRGMWGLSNVEASARS